MKVSLHSKLATTDGFLTFLRWLYAAARDGKTKFNLENALRSPELHRLAWKRLHAGSAKSQPGSDGVTFGALFAQDPERVVQELLKELKAGTYRPRKLRRAHRRSGKKVRVFGIPAMRDRLLQHMIYLLLEPIVEAQLTDACFACRAGLGPVHALWAIRHALQQAPGPVQVVRADIRSYFDKISLETLVELVLAHVQGRQLRRALLSQLRAWTKTGSKGIPQGAPLSPLLANWFLAEVDAHFAAMPGVQYFRYMDDVLILVRGDERRADEVLSELRQRLDRLALELGDPPKTLITSSALGFEFLGMAVRRTSSGVECKITPASLATLQAKLHNLGVPVDGTAARSGCLNNQTHQVVRGWDAYYSGLGDDVATQAGEHLEQLLGYKPGRNCGYRSNPMPARKLPVWMASVRNPMGVSPKGEVEAGKPGWASAAEDSSGVGHLAYGYEPTSGELAAATNRALGEGLERLLGKREFLRHELTSMQEGIRLHRIKRRRARADAIEQAGSESDIDWAWQSAPLCQRVLSAERELRDQARMLNDDLIMIKDGIDMYRQEMTARAQAHGRPLLPGHELLHREFAWSGR